MTNTWKKLLAQVQGRQPQPDASPEEAVGYVLRPYQQEALEAILASDNGGQIILPTGGGKTRIAAQALTKLARNNEEKGETGKVYAIVSPRLMLAGQLDEDFFAALASELDNDPIKVNFHTSHVTNTSMNEKVRKVKARRGGELAINPPIQGTNKDVLRQSLDSQLKHTPKRPVVITVTYASLANLTDVMVDCGREFEAIFFDEAHNLVNATHVTRVDDKDASKGASHILERLPAVKKFFLTATPADTKVRKLGKAESTEEGDGEPQENAEVTWSIEGMSLKELYGEPLYEKDRTWAEDLGLILRLRVDYLKTSTMGISLDLVDAEYWRVIPPAFKAHEEALKTSTIGDVGAGLLVTVNSVKQMQEFVATREAQAMMDDGVQVFTIASEDNNGAGRINGEAQTSRSAWLEFLKNRLNTDGERTLVLHYDILSEGIDCAGFTGWLPLRKVDITTFVQTAGRISRLHKDDMRLVERWKDDPADPQGVDPTNEGDVVKMRKQCAWIQLLELNLNFEENRQKALEWINNILRAGLTPRALREFSHASGKKPDPEISARGPVRGGRVQNVELTQILEDEWFLARSNALEQQEGSSRTYALALTTQELAAES